MALFLHIHEKGYALNALEVKQSYITGWPYAQRHFELARGGGSLGHLVIALIEAMPILGAIAASIERIIASYFPLKADAPLSLPRPLPMPEPMFSLGNECIIRTLISSGRYIQEVGDTAHGVEYVGENQGSKTTRRAFLEMLQAGIDLFSDEVLERLKKENQALYETILIKAFGHVKSKKGRLNSVNYEGSSEALSMLMLSHSVKRLRAELGQILIHSHNIDFAKACDLIDSIYPNIYDYLLYPKLDSISRSSDPKCALTNLIKNYDNKLSEIERCLREACTAESTDAEIKAALKRVSGGVSQIICSGYDWHSELFLFSQNEMIYHNRGALREPGKQIHINQIDGKKMTFELMRSLCDRFSRVKDHFFPTSKSLDAASKSLDAIRIKDKPLKDAKGGFCTHTQAKAVVYSLFSLRDAVLRYEDSKLEYKLFTKQHRIYFNEIYRNHSIPGLV